MKFWQRLVILCSSAFITLTVLYYYTDDGLYENPHINHARLVEPNYWPVKHFSMEQDASMCHFQHTATSRSNISTYDVYQQTDFNLHPDGSYEMPTAPPDFPSRVDHELEQLEVIVVPHSHNDPGWLKTVDEYYVDQTKHILTNMVNKLTDYPNMTFIWAETVYFSMWWNELEDAVKVHVRRLVRRGQLEIVLGGWVMPDEASTHYVSVIDQLLEGHQWMWENLGVKPENSWSIDPFGYSGTMPYLWKKAGMENMVIQRVHQAIKGSLISKNSLEFMWRQYWDTKGANDILCHVMPYMLYSIKYTCGPNRFICLLFDFRQVPNEYSESRAKGITSENLEKQAKYLYEQYRKKSYLYKYNTILVPLGDDFRFDYEVEWDQQYTNYGKLMNYMNNRRDWKINVRFGTLKDYFEHMKQQKASKMYYRKDKGLPVLSGDFFPYSDRNNEYWTGYYTTRPFDKRFSRDVQNQIQAADTLNTVAYAYFKKWRMPTRDHYFKYATFLQQARRSLGLFLHHDAITGTSKEYVVVDYETQLLQAYNATQSVMQMTIQSLLSKGKVESPLVFRPETVRRHFSEQPRKQTIEVQEEGTRVVLFNPLAQFRREVIHLHVSTDHLIIKNDKLQVIPCQVNPIWDESLIVSNVKFEVVFIAELAPFSITPFMLFKTDEFDHNNVFPSKISVYNTETLIVPPEVRFPQSRPRKDNFHPIVMENEKIKLVFKPTNGGLQYIIEKATGNKTDIGLEFLAYKSQGSGAYLFYPSSEAKPAFYINNIPVIRVIEGPLMSRLEVLFQPYLQHSVQLYSHPELQASGVRIANTINIKMLKEKEIIMRMKTDIHSKDSSYYTDQNGFQMIKRKTNKNVRIEANYYPMTSTAFLDDEHRRLTLHSSQSHGVASLESGWLEVMLDRQTIYDDNRGLQESIEDIKEVTLDFLLLLEKRNHLSKQQEAHYALPSLLSTSLNDLLQQPVMIYFSLVDSNIFQHTLLPLGSALPCDTTVVSFRSLSTANLAYNGTSLILHRRGYNCDFPAPGLQCAVTDRSMSLASLLKDFPVGSLRETTLTHLYDKATVDIHSPLGLSPMEIVTYHIRW
ncbi:alpha-mannosidase 2-like [Haliotis asinina]|uniref:alpha-mannosidase 2-like n=1 Tax=Haliotis asinina TaxID=109174 RepID=UPI003531FF3E